MRLNAIVAALILLLASPGVLALSLGEAEAQSYLNQPLRATITVRSVGYDERDTIRALMPDEGKYLRAGVRRDPIIDSIRLDVSDGQAEGELLIHLSTDKRIQEPFLNFLVEVRWLGGSVMREYTLMLDPAPMAEARKRAAEAETGSQDVRTWPIEEDRGWSDSPPSQPRAGGSRNYGPIKRHETLWSVAQGLRTDPGISMDQMQWAIFEANPEAFEGNINRMLTGVMLDIPPNSKIRAIDPDYARRQISRQKSSYQPQAPADTAFEQPAEPTPPAEPEPAYEPEPEPAASYEEPETYEEEGQEQAFSEPSPDTESGLTAADDRPAEEEAAKKNGETPPAEAASPATADGEALTEDELVAGGDEELLAQEDIEMPSVWAGEEGSGGQPDESTVQPEGEQTQQPEPVAQGEPDIEEVVDEAPRESASLTSMLDSLGINPVILLLALALLVVLSGTYWWYRRRKVTYVGDQFAYAGADEADTEGEAQAEKWHGGTSEGTDETTTTVWQDSGAVPDSIDEYTSTPEETEEIELHDIGIEAETTGEPREPARAGKPEESSPIREMTGEEIDYLGEADVHLAYGLYDEAASVLQRGINENPARSDLRLKLLEVYHSGGMSEEFVTAAEDWKKTGIEDEQDWRKAVQMGQEVAPAAAIFAGAAAAGQQAPSTASEETVELETSTGEETEESVALDMEPEAGSEEVRESEPAAMETGDGSLDFDLSNFDLTESANQAREPEAAAEQAANAGDESQAAAEPGEVDLSAPEQTAAGEAQAEETEIAKESAEPETRETSDDTALDFNLDDLDIAETPTEAGEAPADEMEETAQAPEADLSSMTVEEPEAEETATIEPEVGEAAAAETELETGPEVTDEQLAMATDTAAQPGGSEPISDEPAAADQDDDEEVSVKLDLARAYLDMGEPEMARTLLDEVVEMGSEPQQQEARELLSRAG